MAISPQFPVDDAPKHIICFVALPFEDTEKFAYKTVLLPALRTVLEQHPYYWQVGRADDKGFADTIYHNVDAWMQLAHAYIADISDLNPNVMMELGYMYWARKPGQPLMVLERLGTGQHLSDIAGFIRISYPDLSGRYAIEDVAKALADEFDNRQDIQSLNATKLHHYLSPLVLEEIGASEQVAKDLARVYVTMEAFSVAKVKDICRNVRGLSNHTPLATGYKNAVASLLKESKN
jgi:hypothetical protein